MLNVKDYKIGKHQLEEQQEEKHPNSKGVTMEELLRVIIEALVDNKEAISIRTEETETGVTKYIVKVDKSEMGKVIGKGGRVAQAIKSIAKAYGNKNHKMVEVHFED